MASDILGRTPCPIGCGHTAAHVKIKTDKTTEAFPYIHCRGCGIQLHTKNKEQAAYLLKNTRAEALDTPAEPPTPTPKATPPAAVPVPVAPPTPTPAPVPEPRSRFSFGRSA